MFDNSVVSSNDGSFVSLGDSEGLLFSSFSFFVSFQGGHCSLLFHHLNVSGSFPLVVGTSEGAFGFGDLSQSRLNLTEV